MTAGRALRAIRPRACGYTAARRLTTASSLTELRHLARFPRVRFAHLPTPLERMPNLTRLRGSRATGAVGSLVIQEFEHMLFAS
jgi:hypothetical protein